MSPKMLTHCSQLLVILVYSHNKEFQQFWQRYPYKKSEKNNGPRRNDEGQGLNDEGQGLYVPFIHILS